MYLQHITSKRIEEHPQRVHLSREYIHYYSHNNGSSQKACSPGYISPGESTHNHAVTHMSIRRHVNHRLANRCKSPAPDYPKSDYQPPTQRFSVASPRTSLASGKLPTRRMNLPLCRQVDYYYCNELGEVNAGWIPARPASVNQDHTRNNRHNPLMVLYDLMLSKYTVMYYYINRSRPMTLYTFYTIIGAPVDRRQYTDTSAPAVLCPPSGL